MLRLLSVVALCCYASLSFAANDALQECLAQMTTGKTDVFTYTYNEHKTYHSPRPWMTSRIQHHGTMWISTKSCSIRDSFNTPDRDYISLKRYEDGLLLNQPYNSKKPAKMTQSQVTEEVFKIAKYHPAMLLQHFSTAASTNTQTQDKEYNIYSNRINDVPVSLYIDKNNLLSKVTITMYDDLYGDVVYTLHYSRYVEMWTDNLPLSYPQTITFKKVNGITDTLQLNYVNSIDNAPVLIEKPEDYTIYPDKPKPQHTINTKQINNHIYMLHLPQGESAAMLVLFKDFSVIVDVPLNSKNGELALQEARNIAPDKPVKYYAFCHHHPWYVGGMRPFVHAGATVLTQKENIDYLNFIATAPHSLQPDALHKDPQPLKTEVVGKTKTITDGEYSMELYHIGKESNHTEDYTLFYFPQEQILFQGDMVFIPQDKPLSKAGSKQMALYNAIAQRELPVKTIIQAWPWKNRYNMKTIIPYADLEETVKLAQEAKN